MVNKLLSPAEINEARGFNNLSFALREYCICCLPPNWHITGGATDVPHTHKVCSSCQTPVR